MSIITTPAEAIELEDLTINQRRTIRNYLGIGDYPYQPEKTYIVFDADAGDNDLHINTGSSSSYSIYKGDGSLKTDYVDTGGTKTLNYAVAGRYLITIEGTFNGINTDGASQAAKDKYIEVISGSNYPTTITANAFKKCVNLENVKIDHITTVEGGAFYQCNKLFNLSIINTETIGAYAFYNCNLSNLFIPFVTTIGNSAFQSNDYLKNVDAYSLVTIEQSAFDSCNKLQFFTIKYDASLSIGLTAFLGVRLSDLKPLTSNSTQALEVETKFLSADMVKLNGYRLLY